MLMQKNSYFLKIVIFISLVFVAEAQAGIWSQTNKVEFETNTLVNIDAFTTSDAVQLSGQYYQDSNTTLLVHFNGETGNGGLDADYAAGSRTSLNSGAARTTGGGGKWGEAILINGSDDFRYNSASNLPLSEGTLEMWVNMIQITQYDVLWGVGNIQSGNSDNSTGAHTRTDTGLIYFEVHDTSDQAV